MYRSPSSGSKGSRGAGSVLIWFFGLIGLITLFAFLPFKPLQNLNIGIGRFSYFKNDPSVMKLSRVADSENVLVGNLTKKLNFHCGLRRTKSLKNPFSQVERGFDPVYFPIRSNDIWKGQCLSFSPGQVITSNECISGDHTSYFEGVSRPHVLYINREEIKAEPTVVKALNFTRDYGKPSPFFKPTLIGLLFHFRQLIPHVRRLRLHQVGLLLNFAEGQASNDDSSHADQGEESVNPDDGLVVAILGRGRNDPYIGPNVLIAYGLWGWSVALLYRRGRDWRGWLLVGLSLLCFIRLGVSLEWDQKERQRDYQQEFEHDSKNVSQKLLTSTILSYYSYSSEADMANVLNTDKQIAVIAALAEGSSIRSIERMTEIHRDTIMRLGVRVGRGCTSLMDSAMRNLPCTRLEMDEIWGFVGKKEAQVRPGDDPQLGSVWTWCVIDADTKLVPTFKVGDRSKASANAFVQDVASRMKNRVQISTDGLGDYVTAIENAFGADADYGQIVKTFGHEVSDNRRYSPPEVIAAEKKVISGRPDVDLISTSYVERLNATTRLHMRRLTRLTWRSLRNERTSRRRLDSISPITTLCAVTIRYAAPLRWRQASRRTSGALEIWWRRQHEYHTARTGLDIKTC